VAQHRIVATRQHRGHPPGLRGHRPVSDRIDALMQPTEPPGPHPAVDVVSAQPSLQQLGPRDDAVLSIREPGDHEVRGGFAAHIAV
jgi:hypothetical protein